MPSSYTPNFNLNQWEAHDKVERIDFNADNAKIDAALFNHHSAELICTVKAETADVTELILDVSSLDWSRYFALYLDLNIKMKDILVVSTDLSDDFCYGSFGGNTHVYPHLAYFAPAGHGFVAMRTAYSGDTLPSAFNFAFGKGDSTFHNLSISGGSSPHPYREIHQLKIRHWSNQAFLTGSAVSLWGIK